MRTRKTEGKLGRDLGKAWERSARPTGKNEETRDDLKEAEKGSSKCDLSQEKGS
jgi:hypothetical protein